MSTPVKAPLHPYLVLLIALVLPGMGQVANGQANRGVTFLFFVMFFGWITLHFAAPDRSFIARHAGGFFVYAIAVMDAYRFARLRWELYRRGKPGGRDELA
jgi:hypothetical protein